MKIAFQSVKNSFFTVFKFDLFQEVKMFKYTCSQKKGQLKSVYSIQRFRQHSHTILRYCSNVIYELGYKLGSLTWEIGALLIRYKINTLQKVVRATVKNQ